MSASRNAPLDTIREALIFLSTDHADKGRSRDALAALAAVEEQQEMPDAIALRMAELALDRDEGWRQFNQAEIGRLNAEAQLAAQQPDFRVRYECAHRHQWWMAPNETPRGCPVCNTSTFAAAPPEVRE